MAPDLADRAGRRRCHQQQRILDVQLRQQHERVGAIPGSRSEVERITRHHLDTRR